MNKPYRMKAGSRKSYRKQTQHIRRYRLGRWTCVNRGIKYKQFPISTHSGTKIIRVDCFDWTVSIPDQTVYTSEGWMSKKQIPHVEQVIKNYENSIKKLTKTANNKKYYEDLIRDETNQKKIQNYERILVNLRRTNLLGDAAWNDYYKEEISDDEQEVERQKSLLKALSMLKEKK